MNSLWGAIATEFTKARHSRVPWGVAAAFSVTPLVMGVFMIILEDPERARSLGLIGAKAQLVGATADWPTFLAMLGMVIAIGGAILYAFLTAWIFGREFADRTVRGLLASPTRRRTIVLGKTIVMSISAVAITAWVVILSLAIGALLGLPSWSQQAAADAVAGTVAGALLTIALQTCTAFVAGVGRGYIAPLAWAVATIAASQILAVLGWGSWFPWSVPAILAGAGGAEVEPVSAGAVALVLVVGCLGLAATIAWWERADQTG
jgi:ABC-2 type transport system permease protein